MIGLLVDVIVTALFLAGFLWILSALFNPPMDEGDRQAVRNAARMGYSPERISEMSGWPLAKVQRTLHP